MLWTLKSIEMSFPADNLGERIPTYCISERKLDRKFT